MDVQPPRGEAAISAKQIVQKFFAYAHMHTTQTHARTLAGKVLQTKIHTFFCCFDLDASLRNIIDKLAEFVARNGPEFEAITKQKQQNNPKFEFLYGGEFATYYQFRVAAEQQSKQST